MSTPGGIIPSSTAGDRTDIDADADADSKGVVRRPCESHRNVTGLLRKVVWPVTDATAFCCAADECYL